MKETMMIISSVWNDKESFRLIPISEQSPYVECIYDVDMQVLVIISKNKKQSYHMLPKLDDNGDTMTLKLSRRANGKEYKEERKLVDSYQEYYVIKDEEIEHIINMCAVNSNSFDYKKFFKEG
jgi:hypothetical protein